MPARSNDCADLSPYMSDEAPMNAKNGEKFACFIDIVYSRCLN